MLSRKLLDLVCAAPLLHSGLCCLHSLSGDVVLCTCTMGLGYIMMPSSSLCSPKPDRHTKTLVALTSTMDCPSFVAYLLYVTHVKTLGPRHCTEHPMGSQEYRTYLCSLTLGRVALNFSNISFGVIKFKEYQPPFSCSHFLCFLMWQRARDGAPYQTLISCGSYTLTTSFKPTIGRPPTLNTMETRLWTLSMSGDE